MKILDLYDQAHHWAKQASAAGEDELARLVFEAADLLRQAADLYHQED